MEYREISYAFLYFAEPDFPYLDALAPFQPLAMKAFHCPIDTALNFSQANKLIRDLKPENLVVPECYTQSPISAPHRTDLIIEPVAVNPRFCPFNITFSLPLLSSSRISL